MDESDIIDREDDLLEHLKRVLHEDENLQLYVEDRCIQFRIDQGYGEYMTGDQEDHQALFVTSLLQGLLGKLIGVI